MPNVFTYNLVAQFNTPLYCHKRFENKLKWENLAAKTVVFFHSLSKLSKFLKNEKIFFLMENIQVLKYLYEKSYKKNKQKKHSVWLLTILVERLLTDTFADWWWG